MRLTKTLIRLQGVQADLRIRWAHVSEGTLFVALIILDSSLIIRIKCRVLPHCFSGVSPFIPEILKRTLQSLNLDMSLMQKGVLV